MAKGPQSVIPRTVHEANQQGYMKVEGFRISDLSRREKQRWTQVSPKFARPGDVAWVGPCEDSGTRIVCYYDDNLDPSDCRNERC